MRTIDLATWPRRRHFEYFNSLANPYLGLTANLDITSFHPWVKQAEVSFFRALLFLVAKTANGIPEYRHRIRGGSVVEHPVVHPSFTVMGQEELFTFCTAEYSDDFPCFNARVIAETATAADQPLPSDDPLQDDLLYITSIPWLSFTNITFPSPMNPADSFPRFAWGRWREEGGRIILPFAVQGHHALMDGVHISRFFSRLQEHLDDPSQALKP